MDGQGDVHFGLIFFARKSESYEAKLSGSLIEDERDHLPGWTVQHATALHPKAWLVGVSEQLEIVSPIAELFAKDPHHHVEHAFTSSLI